MAEERWLGEGVGETAFTPALSHRARGQSGGSLGNRMRVGERGVVDLDDDSTEAWKRRDAAPTTIAR
jgi:hypothetical protein